MPEPKKIFKSKYYVVEAIVTEHGGGSTKLERTDRIASEKAFNRASWARIEAEGLDVKRYGTAIFHGQARLKKGDVCHTYESGRKILEIREQRQIREELEAMPDPLDKEKVTPENPGKDILITDTHEPETRTTPEKANTHNPNDNRPKKGSTIKVEPIRKQKDIKLIKSLLEGKPLDYAFFVLGINTNLRASDILNIKVGQVRNLGPGESFEIREQKTKKFRQVTFNRACCEAVNGILKHQPDLTDDDYLFTGQRGRWTVPTVSRKVKSWCRTINLKGNYAAHTLRKTWGFHQYHTFKQPLPVLTECFNHASQRQTLDYLCIQAEEVRDVFMNEL